MQMWEHSVSSRPEEASLFLVNIGIEHICFMAVCSIPLITIIKTNLSSGFSLMARNDCAKLV